jgi:hypothetical protein
MSFVRPEVAALARRWGESGAAGAVVLVGVVRGLPLAWRGEVTGWLLCLLGLIALFWLRSAVARGLARGAHEAPGVVEVREGEIRHFGPLSGGIVETDRLVRVEVFLQAKGFEPLWRLSAADGQILMIPTGAKGADRLMDAFEALPGFSDMAAAQALMRSAPGRQLVWQRQGAAPGAAISGS